MRCLDEATATALEGERDDPDLERVGVLLPRHGVHGRARLRAGLRVVRPDRRVRRALREPLHARLLPRRVRRRRTLWRGRWVGGRGRAARPRSTTSRARAPRGSAVALVGLAELRRRQGRPEEAALLLDRAGAFRPAQLCRARLALDRGEALRAVELLERVLRQMPARPDAGSRPGARAARPRPDRARRARRGGRRPRRRCARSSGSSAPRRCGRMRDLAEGMLAGRRAATTSGARTLLEDAVDRFERSGAPFEAARARIELATSLARAGPRRRGRATRRQRPWSAASSWARARRPSGRGGSSRRPACRRSDARSRSSPRGSGRCCGLLAEGLTNRQIAERLVVSEHTVHRHVTNILRKLDLPSRTAAAAHAVRAGLARRPRRIANPG